MLPYCVTSVTLLNLLVPKAFFLCLFVCFLGLWNIDSFTDFPLASKWENMCKMNSMSGEVNKYLFLPSNKKILKDVWLQKSLVCFVWKEHLFWIHCHYFKILEWFSFGNTTRNNRFLCSFMEGEKSHLNVCWPTFQLFQSACNPLWHPCSYLHNWNNPLVPFLWNKVKVLYHTLWLKKTKIYLVVSLTHYHLF